MGTENDDRPALGRRQLLKGGGLLAAGVGVGTMVAASPAGAQVAGLTYTPVDPYRCFDTRPLGVGKIAYDDYAEFTVWEDENGNARIPQTVAAVTFNLTVTATEASGFLSVFPPTADFANTSHVNWWGTGQTLANAGTVRVAPDPFDPSSGAVMVVYCSGSRTAKTHFLVDITGYFA